MIDQTDPREVVRLLSDIRALMQISVKDEIQRIKDEAFTDAKQVEAYRLLDGRPSLREIARKVGVSHPTIGRWVDAWRALGLVDPKDNARTLSPTTLGL